jgi:dUTP pyrophosphatase
MSRYEVPEFYKPVLRELEPWELQLIDLKNQGKVPIHVQLMHPKAKMPTRAYETDAGFDLYALHDGMVPLGGKLEVFFGFAMYFPQDYWMGLYARSSMRRKGICIPTPVYDHGYTGEVNALIFNVNYPDGDWHFKEGDRIAQLIIHRLEPVCLVEVPELPKTERSTNGFGSSGR